MLVKLLLIIKDILLEKSGHFIVDLFLPKDDETKSIFDVFKNNNENWKVIEQVAKDTQNARERDMFFAENKFTNFNRIFLTFTYTGVGIISSYLILFSTSIRGVIFGISGLMLVFGIIRESSKFEYGLSQNNGKESEKTISKILKEG